MAASGATPSTRSASAANGSPASAWLALVDRTRQPRAPVSRSPASHTVVFPIPASPTSTRQPHRARALQQRPKGLQLLVAAHARPAHKADHLPLRNSGNSESRPPARPGRVRRSADGRRVPRRAPAARMPGRVRAGMIGEPGRSPRARRPQGLSPARNRSTASNHARSARHDRAVRARDATPVRVSPPTTTASQTGRAASPRSAGSSHPFRRCPAARDSATGIAVPRTAVHVNRIRRRRRRSPSRTPQARTGRQLTPRSGALRQTHVRTAVGGGLRSGTRCGRSPA